MTNDTEPSVALTDAELDTVAGAGIASQTAKGVGLIVGGVFVTVTGAAIRNDGVAGHGRDMLVEGIGQLTAAGKSS
ncbi:hypothetical protein AB4Z10_03965 [Bosea sp. RAF48]|jgi:hypothetical protein|uniref:hypothetical protein n=1 Tax=Bosea sp. RAF48 TaxID=3237480 RepID=UPI003F8E1D31